MDHTYTPKIAVFIIVYNEIGEVLLHQRANTGFLDGYYDFPSGHVEPNESIQTAAVRELAEETGLQTDIANLELIHINQNNLNTPYIGFAFIANDWHGTPAILEPEKCSDMKFFPVDSLPSKCTLGVRVIAANSFKRGVTYSNTNRDNYADYMGEECTL